VIASGVMLPEIIKIKPVQRILPRMVFQALAVGIHSLGDSGGAIPAAGAQAFSDQLEVQRVVIAAVIYAETGNHRRLQHASQQPTGNGAGSPKKFCSVVLSPVPLRSAMMPTISPREMHSLRSSASAGPGVRASMTPRASSGSSRWIRFNALGLCWMSNRIRTG